MSGGAKLQENEPPLVSLAATVALSGVTAAQSVTIGEVTYAPEVSSGLEIWLGGAVHVQETGSVALNSEFERVTVADLQTIAAGGRVFGQVAVTADTL